MQRSHTRNGTALAWTSCLFILYVIVFASPATAHPLSQGALDVEVHPDRVSVRARVTVEEVLVTDMLAGSTTEARPDDAPVGGTLFERHARYLAAHVHLAADGVPLAGRVVAAEPPTTQPAGQVTGPDQQHAVYELEYALTSRPRTLKLSQDVLVDGGGFAPGVKWEASYVVRIAVADGPAIEGLLLTSNAPIDYECDWTAAAGGAMSRWRLARDYAAHGVHHILTGYDHLLFITALVLAAVGVWDLAKVVTAFTLAHTITLTLAALDLVSLPAWIVEPMIAASIVFVALQNVLWPRQARGWTRLAVAFGFGLFHGLGYAGGLIDAMQSMSGLTVLLAILAFSVGVEIGHQVVVLPLFGMLKLARRAKRELPDRDRVSALALRYGSAAICVLGMYYLYAAVSAAVSTAGHT